MKEDYFMLASDARTIPMPTGDYAVLELVGGLVGKPKNSPFRISILSS